MLQSAASVVGYKVATQIGNKDTVGKIYQGAITLKAAKGDPAFLSTLYPAAIKSALGTIDDPALKLAASNLLNMIQVDPKTNLPDQTQVETMLDGFILGMELVK